MDKPSLKKNYIYSVAYQLLLVLTPIITTPHITRAMDKNHLGIFSYTHSIAYNFYLVAMLGIANYGSRTIASIRDNRQKLSKVFCSLSFMQISFGSLVTVVYCFFLIYEKSIQSENFIFSFVWILYVLSGCFDINWFYWGLEEFPTTVKKNIIIKVLTMLGIVFLVNSNEDLFIYVLIMSGGLFLSSAILWVYVRNYIDIVKVSIRDAYTHFKSNLILFIPVVAVSIYTSMDKIMLGKMCNLEELGVYDNIQKIMTLPTGIITALGTIMLPRITNLLSNNDKEKVLDYIRAAMHFTFFLSVPLFLGIASIAPTFTEVYFGEGFKSSYPMMEMFSITIPFISWANVIRTQYLIPTKKDNVYIISVVCGALLNIIINLLCIPRLKAKGAIIGTIGAEFTVALIQTMLVKKELPVSLFLKDGIGFFVPGSIMFLCVRLIYRAFGTSLKSLIIQICGGALIYLLLSLLIFYNMQTPLSESIKSFLERNK